MPRDRQEDRVRRLHERITAANTVFDRWSRRYETDRLYDYYCGEQWKGYPAPTYDPAYQPYTANLVYSSIETQQPTLLFHRPTVKIEPRPPFADDPASMVAERAKLAQDTVQTYIDKPTVHYKEHTLLALRDANFLFGVVEVGYTSDWIDNPHAGKPVLKKDSDDPMLDDAGVPLTHPDKIPKSEDLFVRRLDPRDFRVSLSDRPLLDENDWVGYREWHYVEDVKRNPRYKNTANLKASGEARDMPRVTEEGEREKHAGMVCLWKLWDVRSRYKCVIAEGHDKYLLEHEPWTYLPFAVLKFHDLRGFYPLPPVFNWLSPQDTVNEVRESRRVHRRRFYRRYTVFKGGMDHEELLKLERGGDGVYAERRTPEDPIKAVEDAPLGPDTDKDLIEAREDFERVSGAGSAAMGSSEGDTATEANIVDVRLRIRESAARARVADWQSEICRIMLLTIRDKMQLPIWIQENADPLALSAAQESGDPQAHLGAIAEIMRVMQTWKQITAQDLGAGELDVQVDITSLSPITEDAQRVAWNEVLALITNPALSMLLAMSEPLLRKTLRFYGVTSERDIAEIATVLKNQAMMAALAQANAAAPGVGSLAKPAGQPAGLPAGGPSVVQ